MSEENVEIVRLAYERLNGGDIDGLIELCSSDFQLDMSERVFNPAVYEGHEGIRRFHVEVLEVWEEFEWEPKRLVQSGDQVVALLHAHGRGRGSGLEIDRRIAMLWTVRESEAISLRLYVDEADALGAAGLTE
jgi:ketosteroid isomerase-like protein